MRPTPSSGYHLTRSESVGHIVGFVWASEILPTKLTMAERERNWKSVRRCCKTMHILVANFHLLANQGAQSNSCYSDIWGFSLFLEHKYFFSF